MRRVIILGAVTPGLIDALVKSVADDSTPDKVKSLARDLPPPILEGQYLKDERPDHADRVERQRLKQEHRNRRQQFEQTQRSKTRKFR